VEPPKRRGFGSLVLEQMVKREIDAAVKASFAPSGIVCTLDMPAVRIEANGSIARAPGRDEGALGLTRPGTSLYTGLFQRTSICRESCAVELYVGDGVISGR
jgi:hypothetical protein